MTHYHGNRHVGAFACSHCPRHSRTAVGILNHIRWCHGRDAVLAMKKRLATEGALRAVTT